MLLYNGITTKKEKEMSNQANDKIIEALWEDFKDLYHTSSSFHDLCGEACWYLFESFDLESLFDKLVFNDLELFLHDKRTAVQALVMFNKSMSHLEEITK
jgi:hypothetical protein